MDLEKIKQNKSTRELLEFGIINIDKPAEWTSFDVCKKIKSLLGAKKTGHFGTLDPMVTGVLPIAINRACKLIGYFMRKNKTYIGEMWLHEKVSDSELEEEMKKFIGKIMQMPPVKSSVKRQLREREVFEFEVLERNGKSVRFIAKVEAGTYIRKLIHDLGEKIGGAHMRKLRRTEAGIFNERESYKIEEIERAWKEYENGNDRKLREMLIPGEIISEIMPVVQIKGDRLKQILTGKPLMEDDLDSPLDGFKEDRFAVFLGDRFIEVARKIEGSSESRASESKSSSKSKDIEGAAIIARPEFVLN